MSIMDIKNKILVENLSLTFEQLIDTAPKEIADSLKDKSVIILPSHGHDDAYYAGTLDTLDYLHENEIEADVYATDAEYKELGLHGADIWLGTFFVKNFVIPIFCSVVAAYIYDKSKDKKRDKVSLEFIVEKKKGASTSVKYDGNVEGLKKVLDAVRDFHNED
ncbi:MAG: hypothetical protein ACRC8B_04635 [Aeromonas sobria]|uniref:hypothetical protein n=1 Tax=Aeromonas sobria TaxID=646 RepID=UPI003F3C3A9E